MTTSPAGIKVENKPSTVSHFVPHLVLLIKGRINRADHELHQPQIGCQIHAFACILVRLQLIVAGRVHHLTNDGVIVQHSQERLRLLVLAHLREKGAKSMCHGDGRSPNTSALFHCPGSAVKCIAPSNCLGARSVKVAFALRTWANSKAMAPGPYWLFAHICLAPLMTFRMVVLGSPAGSPSVIAITCQSRVTM